MRIWARDLTMGTNAAYASSNSVLRIQLAMAASTGDLSERLWALASDAFQVLTIISTFVFLWLWVLLDNHCMERHCPEGNSVGSSVAEYCIVASIFLYFLPYSWELLVRAPPARARPACPLPPARTVLPRAVLVPRRGSARGAGATQLKSRVEKRDGGAPWSRFLLVQIPCRGVQMARRRSRVQSRNAGARRFPGRAFRKAAPGPALHRPVCRALAARCEPCDVTLGYRSARGC